jgi:hypothetical protein
MLSRRPAFDLINAVFPPEQKQDELRLRNKGITGLMSRPLQYQRCGSLLLPKTASALATSQAGGRLTVVNVLLFVRADL